MPRPQRCRRICKKPAVTDFSPHVVTSADVVELTFDEFEVIRLVDFEKQTHEQCAKQMEISRSTVTEIYESAREKIADMLVNGCRLTITGGNYRLCEGYSAWCCKEHCKMKINENKNQLLKKGENMMRIAVTYENGEIFQHFGHSQQFKFYDIEEGCVVSSQIVDTNGSGHGALAGFLAAKQTDTLICGGIGGGAKAALAEAGILLYGGASGSADEAVNALLNNTLTFDPQVHCSHHDNEHHGESHSCGEHSCGEHSCHS